LEKALRTARRKGFTIGGQQLTRVPPGFEKDHPRVDLLRHKTLVASKELGFPDWLASPRTRAEITKLWRTLAPLTTWLHTHVGPA
jgi:hypothetical protein